MRLIERINLTPLEIYEKELQKIENTTREERKEIEYKETFELLWKVFKVYKK